MRLVVFGANGATGRLVSAQALSEGHSVTAITRHPDQFPITHDRLTVVAGDVFNPESVDRTIAGHDAVLSSIGAPYSFKKVTLFSVGIANITGAMQRQGVERLVCVSSSGTDPASRTHNTGGGWLFEKVLKPAIVATLGKTVYTDMLRMEQLVKASDLDWTILRPGALFHTSAVTDYRTDKDFVAGRYTSRADLADCMLRQLDAGHHPRTAVGVATFSVQPTMIDVFWNEALQSLSKGNP